MASIPFNMDYDTFYMDLKYVLVERVCSMSCTIFSTPCYLLTSVFTCTITYQPAVREVHIMLLPYQLDTHIKLWTLLALKGILHLC